MTEPVDPAVTDWPGQDRREPRIGNSAYLIHRGITRSLSDARDAYLQPGVRILDVGCGVQPYYPLFAPIASAYDGNDVTAGPRVRYVSPAESLPAPSDSYDLVLCTQVLEHVRSPSAALAEMSRVLSPGGFLFLTTHGVYPFHPDPADYWRWTEQGLAAAIEDAGGLNLVGVVPHGGSGSALAVLVNTGIREMTRAHRYLAPLAIPLIAAVNGVGLVSDRLLPDRARAALVPNFLVVARRE
jgi:SAM-dependent methyltransferase